MAKKKDKKPVIFDETFKTIDYSDEMQSSYIDYSMSVIISRAIPDIRDGLKPVQRRTLYSMDSMGIKHDKPYKKSARIVGDTMGKYHPHGDSSIYESMVHLSQDWCYNTPLVDGHGNFGSIEGDGPAAQRYTEARMSKLSEVGLLNGLNLDTVDFVTNFDETEKEPEILPAAYPNLLVSGSEGIAVGMSTKIPTHNIGEVIDATIAYMDNKKMTTKELMEYLPGPDFATGGIISNKNDLLNIYETGAGKIRIRARVDVEPTSGGRTKLVITEIPQPMIGSIDKFMETVADLVRNKKAPDITDVYNQSGKEGIRIIVEIRKGADIQSNINLLYKKARLEDTFGVNMLAIKDQTPVVFSLKEMLSEFVSFSLDVNKRRYTLLLGKQLKQKNVLEGLIKAIDIIDVIIAVLRSCKSVKDARECLMTGMGSDDWDIPASTKKIIKKLAFNEEQAIAILEMRLSRLIGLELEALEKQLKEADKNISAYEKLLKSDNAMKKHIKKRLIEIRDEFGHDRKTEIKNEDVIVLAKQEIVQQEYFALIDRFGYIKLVDSTTYQRNQESCEKEFKQIISIMNTDKLLVFTDDGKMHSIKAQDIPLVKYKDKGVPIENLCVYTKGSRILLITPLEDIKDKTLLFVNSQGAAKKTAGSIYDVSKKTTDSTKLTDGAKLVNVTVLSQEENILIKTKQGMYIRFKTDEIPEKGKTAVGVRAIKLKDDDTVEFALVGSPSTEIVPGVSFSKIKLTKRDNFGIKSKI